ncbi:DUF7512 family protein [Halovivax gelatinilyticus]|nr:hypothetical protein [Halovivax gelatinilyticus]
MIETLALPWLLQGGLVVGLILVLAVALYLGYAVVERVIAQPLLKTIEER